jgi:ThiF family
MPIENETVMDGPPLTPIFGDAFNLKVIGLGGTGSITADYVTLWLNAQSSANPRTDFRVVLIDGDHFEPSNARMFFSAYGNKAKVKRDDLLHRLSGRLQRLTITAVDEYVTPQNIGRLIHDGDTVLLCVDSHASRKLVSDHFAGHVRTGTLISAGNDGVGRAGDGRVLRGTYGNCQVYVRRDGADVTPSLTSFHPEIDDPRDTLPTDAPCTALVETVPQLLFANYWAAGAILSSLYLALCGPDALGYGELVFDIAEGRMQPFDV